MIPQTRDLVLIGGGHSHALVLRMFAMAPLPGLRVTVIDPSPEAAYSGMLPGFVAGHYTRDQLNIDLVRLARIAGARVILGGAEHVDRAAQIVHVSGRPPVAYDLLSIDIGITTAMPDLPGFAEHGVPAKPLGPFARAWDAFAGSSEPDKEAAVIGAGVAGAELAMAMAHRTGARVHLIDRGAALAAVAPRAALRLRTRFDELGVVLHENAVVTGLREGAVCLETGDILAQFITGAASPRPHGWLAHSGLDLHAGYVTVGPTLQSSDPIVFAAGDCAHMGFAPRPKAGVFAVRQAPVLFANLRAMAKGQAPRRRYQPQRDYLKLMLLGSRSALAEKAGVAVAGPLMWRWKDRIDRRFMERFAALRPMETAAPREAAAGADGAEMLCAGCGGKVGAGALKAAMIAPVARSDVVALPGDDAAALRFGDQMQVISTDHLRALVDDPVVMTRIAAEHALGDIWAMGARPQAALTQVTLPRLSPELQQRTMAEITRVAQEVFGAVGASIVGGHSTMGAEMVIGFTVTGLCADPVTLAGAQPGDDLVLTKPIGSGTVMAAEMRGMARGAEVAEALAWMVRSNALAAAELTGAQAMTDVTGFGLAGHLWNICEASGVSARVDLSAVPVMAGALRCAEAGVRSSIWTENRGAVPLIERPSGTLSDLLFDPQTSGGLLAAVTGGASVVEALREQGCPAAIIGRVEPGPARIVVEAE